MSSAESVPPVVCTLTKKELVERGLEWGDLAGLAIGREAIEHGVASMYPLELHDQLADLVTREMDCCGTWMDSRIERRGDVLRLELTTTNPDGLGLIRSMAGLAQSP